MSTYRPISLDSLRADGACSRKIDWANDIGLFDAEDKAPLVLRTLLEHPDYFLWAVKHGYSDFVDFTALPEGLRVRGDLYLQGTNIKELPEGLHVGGNLYIHGTNIKALPQGLHVGGCLYLHGTNIKEVPRHLASKAIY
jgi:hypothetical protein